MKSIKKKNTNSKKKTCSRSKKYKLKFHKKRNTMCSKKYKLKYHKKRNTMRSKKYGKRKCLNKKTRKRGGNGDYEELDDEELDDFGDLDELDYNYLREDPNYITYLHKCRHKRLFGSKKNPYYTSTSSKCNKLRKELEEKRQTMLEEKSGRRAFDGSYDLSEKKDIPTVEEDRRHALRSKSILDAHNADPDNIPINWG